MMARHQWRFEDPADANPETRTWTFPYNPNKMSSPHPRRSITTEVTTAIDGQVLLWEGQTPAKEWSFGGFLLTRQAYEDLHSWVYGRQGRLFLFDHFGRRYVVVPMELDAEIVRRYGRYWRHDYTVSCMLLGDPSAPTVSESGE